MVKRSKRPRRVKVSADGAGVVSHAGVGMLRELSDLTGLTSQVSGVLADTYKGPWVHDPGRVFTDLAAAVADGADCVSGIGSLVDQRAQHGPVASVTTAWRLIDSRVDARHLGAVKAARGGWGGGYGTRPTPRWAPRCDRRSCCCRHSPVGACTPGRLTGGDVRAVPEQRRGMPFAKP